MLWDCEDWIPRQQEIENEMRNHLNEIASKNGKFLKLLLKQYRITSISTLSNGGFVYCEKKHRFIPDFELLDPETIISKNHFEHLIEYEDMEGNRFQWAV